MINIKDKTFDEWDEDYHNIEVVDLKHYLSKDNFETLKKLGIEILDKIYTGYEYECLRLDIAMYYTDDDMDEEEKKLSKSIKDKNVSEYSYKNLVNNIDYIDEVVQM